MAAEARVFPTREEAVDALARAIVGAAAGAIAVRGRFTIALSGGESPRALHELLATRYASQIEWPHVEVFFGDERCVPLTHEHSNFRMAMDTLLARVRIPPSQVHAMFVPGETPGAAARRYEALLRSKFPGDGPALDVAIMGMGPDGHTASIFPGSDVLRETERWVLTTEAPAPFVVPDRLTLTLPFLRRTRCVQFLVVGASKRDMVARALRSGLPDRERPPAALLQGLEATEWFLDEAAAGQKPEARG